MTIGGVSSVYSNYSNLYGNNKTNQTNPAFSLDSSTENNLNKLAEAYSSYSGKKADVKSVMDNYDKDGDGSISGSELETFLNGNSASNTSTSSTASSVNSTSAEDQLSWAIDQYYKTYSSAISSLFDSLNSKTNDMGMSSILSSINSYQQQRAINAYSRYTSAQYSSGSEIATA